MGSAHLAHLRIYNLVRVICLCAIALSFLLLHWAAGCIFLLFPEVCNTYVCTVYLACTLMLLLLLLLLLLHALPGA